MSDQSHLDRKYFIDRSSYNCPYCNRNHVTYGVDQTFSFDWKPEKKCYGFIAVCRSCGGRSLHLSFIDTQGQALSSRAANAHLVYTYRDDLDEAIFYSVPTSFFVMDERIPHVLRELVTEAEGCLKMNYLTGASACARKAIYELLVQQQVSAGSDYGEAIKSLKPRYPEIDPEYFDTLAHLQNLTSDKVHEQSWGKWDSPQVRLVLETLKEIFGKLFVVPDKERQRRIEIMQLRKRALKEKQSDDQG